MAKKIEYIMENKKKSNNLSKNAIKNAKRYSNKFVAEKLWAKITCINRRNEGD